MSFASKVIHNVPKPVSFAEFRDAVKAACPPRFPDTIQTVPRRVALAISGGVDSMALAYLFWRLHTSLPTERLADNLISPKPVALVVDHKLRPGSTEEVDRVGQVLRRMGYSLMESMQLKWHEELGLHPDTDPSTLPNLESLARRLRYRRIGERCSSMQIASLLTAHHEDDQYETVLMRLLSGHGVRGIRGMATANNIPECYGIHGAHESGFVDDQMRLQPYICFRPRRRDWRFVRRQMRSEMDWKVYGRELRAGLSTDLDVAYIESEYYAGNIGSKARRKAPAVAPIMTEDAGVTVYRPLLEFSKDRLRATCEANGVTWFEDGTNKDPTLTMRNAVRHMWQGHDLPAALQKPAILELAERSRARTELQDSEADRLMQGMASHSFDPNAGTFVFQLPHISKPKPRRKGARHNRKRAGLRLARKRTIATLIIRRLVAFSSPENTSPQLPTLLSAVPRLFPSLATRAELDLLGTTPKAFNQASVLFTPIESAPNSSDDVSPNTLSKTYRRPKRLNPQKWLLAREPHPSTKPLPSVNFVFPNRSPIPYYYIEDPSLTPEEAAAQPPTHIHNQGTLNFTPPVNVNVFKNFGRWRKWEIFDKRYWVRVRARYKGILLVAPFHPDYAKEFREGLDPKGRAALADVLRKHAPGKIRYTLPALYTIEGAPPPSWFLDGNPYDGIMDNGVSPDAFAPPQAASLWDDREIGKLKDGSVTADHLGVRKTSKETKETLHDLSLNQGIKRRTRLLGLLTMPIQLPGVEQWVEWQIRYKKVDTELLEKTMPVERPVMPEDVASAREVSPRQDKGGRRRAWKSPPPEPSQLNWGAYL